MCLGVGGCVDARVSAEVETTHEHMPARQAWLKSETCLLRSDPDSNPAEFFLFVLFSFVLCCFVPTALWTCSLGPLLFGRPNRNCRCCHCPGINSNYALYSDSFCAPPAPPHTHPFPLRPRLPPHQQAPPPSSLKHTHTHVKSKHTFPAFLTHPPFTYTLRLPPPPPPLPPTLLLIWLLEHSGPTMNERACGDSGKEMNKTEEFVGNGAETNPDVLPSPLSTRNSPPP